MGDILNHSFGRRIGNCSVRAAVTNPSPSRSPRQVCICSSLSPSLSRAEDEDSRVLGGSRGFAPPRAASGAPRSHGPVPRSPLLGPRRQALPPSWLSGAHTKPVFLVSPGNPAKCQHHQSTNPPLEEDSPMLISPGAGRQGAGRRTKACTSGWLWNSDPS